MIDWICIIIIYSEKDIDSLSGNRSFGHRGYPLTHSLITLPPKVTFVFNQRGQGIGFRNYRYFDRCCPLIKRINRSTDDFTFMDVGRDK